MEDLDREGPSTARLVEGATSMNASERRTRERLEMLSEAGLVAPIFDGARMHELTSEGQRYLEGELDAANHIDRPNPHAV
jgi:predicted transcriptional regulator